ncbi:hypothetical protein I4F81_004581 [Pyropia yezoensis]|uniref:Uncharacterized protein n=1 Tax=Pyropia yezoensis TaxID=2788 RepID=A0ACC3BVN5_PYRYE|nr:hypothetical protein I4F81_004581 [Neopyropia yezoensis]
MRSTPAAAPSEAMMLPSVVHGFSPLRALLLLSVFPRTFDLDAATSVLASRIAPREVLAPLLGAQLLTSVDDRLELNAVAKLFVTEETLPIKNLTLTDADAATVAARELGDPPPTDLTQSLVAAGRARFVSYFQSVLRSLDDESIHKLGWARERAMAVYDVERDNMDAAAQIARASASEKPLRQFLTAGASIMRYCVPAFSRVDYLCKAVEATDAASTSPPTKLDAGGGRGGRGGVDAGGDTSMLPPISPHSAAAAKTERVAEATAAVAQVVAAHKAAAVATEAAAAAAEAAAAADATGGPVGDRLLPLDGAAAAARRQREEAEIERARVAAAAAMAAGDGGGGSAMGGGEAAIPAGVCPELRSKARLHLALGEAHCDTLNVEAAEEPLQRAMELMGEVSPARSCLPELIDSVLVLLLVASIRMQATPPRTREARALLVRALRVLTAAGLGKTTLAVNAMTNLTQIHLRRGELLKARSVVSQLLDVLDTMRYSKMPIYADALGSQAMVSLALGDAPAAERQFSAALEVVAEWGTKTWGSLPVQHCLDLDLWLLEGLARAMRVQGRVEDAASVGQGGNGWGLGANPKAEDVVIPYGAGTCASPLNDAFELSFLAAPDKLSEAWEIVAGSNTLPTDGDAESEFFRAGHAFHAVLSRDAMASHKVVDHQLSAVHFRPLPSPAAHAPSALVYEEEITRLLSLQRNQKGGFVAHQRGVYNVLGVGRASVGIVVDKQGKVVAAQDRVSGGFELGSHLSALMYQNRDGQHRPVLAGESALLTLGRGVMADPSWLGSAFPRRLKATVRMKMKRDGAVTGNAT